MEEWRAIRGFPAYEVSDLGRVRRVKTQTGKPLNRVLRTPPQSNGYARVSLSVQNHIVSRMVHVLVAEAFFGPRPENMVIDHVNGVRVDNRRENLEYVTHVENVRRGWRLELDGCRPSRRRKLVENDVREIRRLYAAGGWSQRALARRYNVATVEGILNGKKWKQVV